MLILKNFGLDYRLEILIKKFKFKVVSILSAFRSSSNTSYRSNDYILYVSTYICIQRLRS